LVAELGAAFLCAELGITPETREDHAAYIASWLKALQDDKRFIFSAAAHAQRAVDYLTRTRKKPKRWPLDSGSYYPRPLRPWAFSPPTLP
jgi:antirestriction protein ArdC